LDRAVSSWSGYRREKRTTNDIFTDDVLYFMPRRKNVPRRESHRELTPLGDPAILEEDGAISRCGWPAVGRPVQPSHSRLRQGARHSGDRLFRRAAQA
jgi:hypothetical protein